MRGQRGAGLRIARLSGYFDAHLTPSATAAVDRVLVPHLTSRASDRHRRGERCRAAAFVITASEGGGAAPDDLRTRRADMEPLSRDRFRGGRAVARGVVLKAQRVRAWYRELV